MMIPTRRKLTSLEKAIYNFFHDREICIGDRLALADINTNIQRLKMKLPFYQECAMVDEICDKFGLYKDLSNYIKDKVADNYDFYGSDDECSCESVNGFCEAVCNGYDECEDYVDRSLMCSCCYIQEENSYFRLKDPTRKLKRDKEIALKLNLLNQNK